MPSRLSIIVVLSALQFVTGAALDLVLSALIAAVGLSRIRLDDLRRWFGPKA